MMDPVRPRDRDDGKPARWRRLRAAAFAGVTVAPGEARAVGLAFVFHFVVLASYYVLRPIRDEIGAAGGLENLSWLFTATLVAMLAANVLFSAVAARQSRRRFIPLAYRCFIGTLGAFFLLMQVDPAGVASWVGSAFYVWVSVFNLFVVSVFWAFMADLFTAEQGKRLFGFIAVGGTLGAILGGVLTAQLVHVVGSAALLVLSALLLEVAVWCVKLFPERPVGAALAATVAPKGAPAETGAEWPLGGTFWSGIAHVFRSPYLLGICGFMLLHSVTSTLVYFQQADLAGQAFADRAARTTFFARLDVAVNVLTVVMQVFLTGRLLKWLGVGLTLALLPLVSLAGFAAMALAPSLALLAAFQVARRAVNYAVSRPAREVLFTVLPREDKYKAKAFTDTFVYRAGDQLGAWSYPALRALGLGLAGVSLVGVPLAAAWVALSVWLGRRQADPSGAPYSRLVRRNTMPDTGSSPYSASSSAGSR
jgi:ATP:ADP antiporter, AAA family